jgi:hypothetical protein
LWQKKGRKKKVAGFENNGFLGWGLGVFGEAIGERMTATLPYQT